MIGRTPSRRSALLIGFATLVSVGVVVAAVSRDSRRAGDLNLHAQLSDLRISRTPGGCEVTLDDASGRPMGPMTPGQFIALLDSRQGEVRSQGWVFRVLNITTPFGLVWIAIGLTGQLLFTGRMIVQWLVSERQKRSTVPVAFWWMSLGGSTMLITYFLWRKDIVGVLGQATGWLIYLRNLAFIYRPQASLALAEHGDSTPKLAA